MMATDFDAYVAVPTGGDDAPQINNAFMSYQSVRVAGPLKLRSAINLPANKQLYAECDQYITKEYNGPMLVMGEWSKTSGILWEGNGLNYTGPGIKVVNSTLRQEIKSTRVMRCEGACLDMSEYAAGGYCNVSDCMFQRQNLALPAIVLCVGEAGTQGVRRFSYCSGGGGMLIDLAASNVTTVAHCDTYRVLMGPNSRYAKLIDNRFAIPSGEVLHVRGSNHRFSLNTTSEKVVFTSEAIGSEYDASNYDNGVVLEFNTWYNRVGRMILSPEIVDNSGNTSNQWDMAGPIPV